MDNLHPHFRTIEMRRKSTDGLNISTTDARGGVVNLDLRIVAQRLLITEGIIVPGQFNGSRALSNRAYFGDHRNKVARSVQLLEEIQAGLGIIQGATIGQ